MNRECQALKDSRESAVAVPALSARATLIFRNAKYEIVFVNYKKAGIHDFFLYSTDMSKHLLTVEL